MSDWYDSLREYALRVAGRDDSWKKRSLCNESTEFQACYTADEDDWLVDADDEWVTGYEAQRRVVEQFCFHCPVQWECARWGIEVNEEVGVYALTVRERRWLINNRADAALALIDAARVSGTPVQVAVRWEHYPSTRPAV